MISMEIWIGWGDRKSVMLSIFGIGALLVKFIYRIPWTFSLRNILLCTAFYIGYILIHPAFEIREYLTQIPPQLLPICCIVFLRDEYKEKVLQQITKWYAWLISISLITYFVTMFIDLPNFGALSNGDRYGIFSNYLIYVKEYGGFDVGYLRFGGPFLEPGYVGMIGSFLIFVNQYNLKQKENLIILFSIIVSFSLAGWVLSFIGFFFIQFYKGNIRLSGIMAFAVILISFLTFGFYYNGGDNLINREILSRLAYDEVRLIAGNNRNVSTMMEYFDAMWDNKELLLHGYPLSAFSGLSDWETVGAGFERFVVFHGLLGVLYVFMFYLISLFYAKDKKYVLLFFVLVCVCFWQRTYALWFSWIICFHYSCISHDIKKVKCKSNLIT